MYVHYMYCLQGLYLSSCFFLNFVWQQIVNIRYKLFLTTWELQKFGIVSCNREFFFIQF